MIWSGGLRDWIAAITYFREEVRRPNVEVWREEAGLLALLDFLVMSTTPPFSPAWMPMAYIHCHKHISNTSIFHYLEHFFSEIRYGQCCVPCRSRNPHTAPELAIASNADGLKAESHLSRVLVLQVQRIARELHATCSLALHQRRTVSA